MVTDKQFVGTIQGIGTNRPISRKQVSSSLSAPYDFIQCLRAQSDIPTSTPPSSRSDEISQSPMWCAREDLNLHPLRDQILSLARLPFRHSRDAVTDDSRADFGLRATITPRSATTASTRFKTVPS